MIGCVVAGAGCLVLLGWATGVHELTAVAPSLAPMKPNSAVCFVLIGLALALRARTDSGRARAVGGAFGIASLLIAGATLAEYALGIDFGIDTLLMSAGAARGDGVHPGRMSCAASIAHALGALACLALPSGPTRRFPLSEVFAVATCAIGLTAVFGYVLGVNKLFSFSLFEPMSLVAGVLYVLLSVGLLVASPHHPFVRTLASPYLGGVLARRLLCYTAFGSIALNWLAIVVQHRAGYEPEVTIALITVVGVLTMSGLTLGAASWLNSIDEQRRAMTQQQSAMMSELDHRVKNNLASVLALTNLTLGTARSLDEFRDSFVGRIRALARTHEALAASRWEGVRITDVVRLTIGPYAAGEQERVVVQGPDVLLPAACASALCASLHELATNAAKYGALKHEGGRVRIAWTYSPAGELAIEWRETGVASIRPPQRPGFGTAMITGAVVHEMQGTVEFEYEPPGLVCRIRLVVKAPSVRSARNETPVLAQTG